MSNEVKLFNAVTEFDRRASKRKGYNPHALGHYAAALQNVKRYVAMGHDLRDAIITCFLGRLCDCCLKSVGLDVMTKDEAKYGLANRLPQLDD